MQHLLVIPKAGFTITKGEDLLKEYSAPDNNIGMVAHSLTHFLTKLHIYLYLC